MKLQFIQKGFVYALAQVTSIKYAGIGCNGGTEISLKFASFVESSKRAMFALSNQNFQL